MKAKVFCISLALTVAFLLTVDLRVAAQMKAGQPGPDYSKGQASFPNVFAPYTPIRVGSADLTNSVRIEQLVKDGKLQLSLQDAIALALENNLDIAVQRYTPWIADTDVLRAKSGGATRGLAGTGTASSLGNIPSQNFDPVVTTSLSWNRASIPVNNPFLSGTGVTTAALTNYAAQANFQYSQGFPSGTAYAITFNNTRASSTSPVQLFDPSVNSTLFFSFSQQLMNGFGFLPNTRFIQIAKNSKRQADFAFIQQVITTVSQVQAQYWDLVFAREDVKVKQRSVELAQKLYNDNKRQVEIGTLAPIEVVRAESQLANSRQDLIVSQTLLLQQQTLVKNAISKNPLDPLLLSAEIVPTDVIVQPPLEEILPLQDAVKEALEKRPDVKQAQLDLKNQDINARATRNALLPVLSLFGQFGGTGLAGNSAILGGSATAAGSPVVDANGNAVAGLFVPKTQTPILGVSNAGVGAAWASMSGFDFPTYTLALNLTIPIKNRSAQADNARALLQQRQSEVRLRQLQNSVVVDVRNTQIALEQNRARVMAAQKARELAQQTLDAEQKKFQLGASTIFFVIQAQRDLAQAASNEVRALTDLMKSRADFERALGRTLEVNNISIADARSGQVQRNPLIPGTVGGGATGASEKF